MWTVCRCVSVFGGVGVCGVCVFVFVFVSARNLNKIIARVFTSGVRDYIASIN